MRLFSALYDRVMHWAAHRHAPWYLGAISFAESSFFPIPPDVMLAPMALAKRDAAWFYAALTTVTSVLGGLFGYLIGVWAFDFVTPWIQAAGYRPAYERAVQWFGDWGVWAVLIAGFTPIPYKVFTIAAGAVAMPLLPFIIGSVVGRGARFFLVAGLMRWGGEGMQRLLRNYVERIGWLLLALACIAYVAAQD